LGSLSVAAVCLVVLASIALAVPPELYTPGYGYALEDRITSTSVFVWYPGDPNGGQHLGPWRPQEGRAAWNGTPEFWQRQIKQIMSAGIDVMNVHMMHQSDTERTNLFLALNRLRGQGYDVPKVTPFLDPLITWSGTTINTATAAGKQAFVDEYIDFYTQYFSVNQDEHAGSYLTRIDGCTVLDTWHVHINLEHFAALSREDVQSRLQAALGNDHPVFNDDVYMITTRSADNTFNWANEQVVQFQTQAYYDPTLYNDITSVQLKPGYWDQNIRDPGTFFPRDGGVNYAAAWDEVNANQVDRVYIESWNEYDEGSGIYAGDSGVPYIRDPPNDHGNTDVWSASSNPREYIETTAAGVRRFNDRPDHDSRILWHDFPDHMLPGETRRVQVVVRNEGDVAWSAAEDYKFGQQEWRDGEVVFGPGRFLIDDVANEVPVYGGIFRGRPLLFEIDITAPLEHGVYATHWGMAQEHVAWFGEELELTITVAAEPSAFGLIITGGVHALSKVRR
jgi:hypothetical protein